MQSYPEVISPSSITTGAGNHLPLADICAAGFLARYSGCTFKSYRQNLKLFFQWCAEVGIQPLDAKRPHIDLYMRTLEARGLATSTICGRFGTVALFYRYAVIDEHLDKDPTVHVRRPKADTAKKGTHVTRREIEDILQAAFEMSTRPAAWALVSLLAVNGFRINEALGLDIERTYQHQGLTTVNVHGKGAKVIDVPLAPPVAYAVGLATAGRDSGPILLGDWTKHGGHHQRMSPAGARDLIDKIVIGRLGWTHKRITPHSFRRGAITVLLDEKVPLREAQHFARHSDPRTTSLYDRGGDNPARHATHILSAAVASLG